MKRLSRREKYIIDRLCIRLMTGERFEISAKAGVFYLGSSDAGRIDPFWYEGPLGRTYKETTHEVVEAVLSRVGIAALECAKELPL